MNARFKPVVVGLLGLSILGLIASRIIASPGSSSVPRLKRARPGSREDKRLKVLRALANRGQYPVYKIGSSTEPKFAVKAAPNRGWLGTKINVHPDAKGDMLKLQTEFADAMSKSDPQPANRKAHFAWLGNTEHFQQRRARVAGWYGGIVWTDRTPSGSWLMKVQISPWIDSSDRGVLFDHVIETYEYANGKLRLIDSDAAIPKPNLQVYPAAQ